MYVGRYVCMCVCMYIHVCVYMSCIYVCNNVTMSKCVYVISLRYHEFREIWDTQKPPGEEPRHTLRWHIRVSCIPQQQKNKSDSVFVFHRNNFFHKTPQYMNHIIIVCVNLVITLYQQARRGNL